MAQPIVMNSFIAPEVLKMLHGGRPPHKEYQRVVKDKDLLDQLSVALIRKLKLKPE